MSYTINNTVGEVVATVQDGTVNTDTSLNLIGRDVPSYGEIQNENFVFLMENFANTSSPRRPIIGQLWFDTLSNTIRLYDGTNWKAVGGVESSTTQPSSPAVGDLWYDITAKKLFIWDGFGYSLLGPQSVPGKGITEYRAKSVSEPTGGTHAVLECYVDGVPVFVVSSDPEFTLSSADITIYNNKFTTLRPGINLLDTNIDGVTLSARFWGTASDSDKLGGHSANEYLLSNNLQFTDNGFSVGNNNDLHVYVTNGTPNIENKISNTLTFKTTSGSITNIPLQLVDNTIVPGITNTTNIGSANSKFLTVYANTFDGKATKADSLNVSGNYYAAYTTAAANSIAARDVSGNLTANVFNGVATSARFADLAEKYLTDKEYPVGTVMMIGGEFEATEASAGRRAIGVISGHPGYMMNCELEGGQYIALKGRVPVFVTGMVNKGDELSAFYDGTAIVSQTKTFAIALESSYEPGIKLIEAVIL
jgi:hypothetical protein